MALLRIHSLGIWAFLQVHEFLKELEWNLIGYTNISASDKMSIDEGSVLKVDIGQQVAGLVVFFLIKFQGNLLTGELILQEIDSLHA